MVSVANRFFKFALLHIIRWMSSRLEGWEWVLGWGERIGWGIWEDMAVKEG